MDSCTVKACTRPWRSSTCPVTDKIRPMPYKANCDYIWHNKRSDVPSSGSNATIFPGIGRMAAIRAGMESFLQIDCSPTTQANSGSKLMSPPRRITTPLSGGRRNNMRPPSRASASLSLTSPITEEVGMCPRLQDPLDIPCRQVAVQAQDTAASLARLLPALQEPSRVASLQTYGIDLT